MKLRMQNPDQRGQQHHVAERAATHCQRPRHAAIEPSVNERLGGTNSPNFEEYRRASIIQ
jgi:hypothetical protein